MARRRISAAKRKAAVILLKDSASEADMIAAGVRLVAGEIAPLVKQGALYWTAPLQYVVEQMAPRVCREHGLELDRVEDVAGYLNAAFQEYVVALVGEFDVDHFEVWTAAMKVQEGKQV